MESIQFIRDDTRMLRLLLLAFSFSLLAACGGSGSTSNKGTPQPVQDTTPPTISLNGDAELTIEVGSDYTELGATATDLVDGQVDVITEGMVNAFVLGEYTIIYTATDKAGNTATSTRKVLVVDTTPPTIILDGDAEITLEGGSSYEELGASANDNHDGDIDVIVSGTVNTMMVGTYTLTYSASDKTGNTATSTRTVSVVDTTPPTITLNGDAEITLEGGSAYEELGANANDKLDGDIDVVVSGTVDTMTVRTYILTYTASDKAGNTATATRVVSVVDSTDGSGVAIEDFNEISSFVGIIENKLFLLSEDKTIIYYIDLSTNLIYQMLDSSELPRANEFSNECRVYQVQNKYLACSRTPQDNTVAQLWVIDPVKKNANYVADDELYAATFHARIASYLDNQFLVERNRIDYDQSGRMYYSFIDDRSFTESFNLDSMQNPFFITSNESLALFYNINASTKNIELYKKDSQGISLINKFMNPAGQWSSINLISKHNDILYYQVDFDIFESQIWASNLNSNTHQILYQSQSNQFEAIDSGFFISVEGVEEVLFYDYANKILHEVEKIDYQEPQYANTSYISNKQNKIFAIIDNRNRETKSYYSLDLATKRFKKMVDNSLIDYENYDLRHIISSESRIYYVLNNKNISTSENPKTLVYIDTKSLTVESIELPVPFRHYGIDFTLANGKLFVSANGLWYLDETTNQFINL
ncbi:DUF5011 domain-containing protein [Pseudoalteromonas piratica]|uniref:DUF5011 domain-containing protein n=1 Tax=Pseudoalteromonas piratica TaxID=1348114 RepID=UPI001900C897|nr:DUF5011 domain-containing protein [Pseudoalteromonas piratica]